ncbi:MAG: glycosyltransferase, partial [Nitrospinae bacterium]|nr:glycosyltransferase [Nitrospinota bacterium]
IFISDLKRKDWDFEGDLILPGIDVNDYPEYTGEVAKGFVVGNLVKERDLMMGYTDQQELLKGVPHLLMGLNPTIPESRLSESWDDLKNHYKTYRFYLNTTVNGKEDGYNLAMLEAMATGMPVVSTRNSSTPIQDGKNGFITIEKVFLRQIIEELLIDRAFAVRIGKMGRQTILEKFNINLFVKKWNRAIRKAIKIYCTKIRLAVKESTPKYWGEKSVKIENILLNYVYYPATTAYYLDRGFRKNFNVVSSGATINQEIVEKWNLQKMKKELKPQDIPTDFVCSAPYIRSATPKKWTPQLFIWMETGIGTFPEEMEKLDCPAACYLVDTHIHLERHLEIAKHFDFVFIAQREYLPEFLKRGIKCYWLPLGCDPEIHARQDVEKKYDIGFVGSITNPESRRAKLLGKLADRYSVHIERAFHEEMAEIFSASEMVFNNCIRNDLNMRAFEVLCSGSFLFTDLAKYSGMERIFIDGKTCGVYQDETICENAEYYLKNKRKREKIAAKGMKTVLDHHTYEHRCLEMIDVVEKELTLMLKERKEKNLSFLEKFQNMKKEGNYKEILYRFFAHLTEIPYEEVGEVKRIVAEAYAFTGKMKRAKAMYGVCLGEAGKKDETHVSLGTLALEEDDISGGYEHFTQALFENNKNAKAHCGLGFTLLKLERFEDAEECFVESLQINHDNPLALKGLIETCQRNRCYFPAISWLEKYTSLHQTELDFVYSLAFFLSKNGEKEKALTQLDKILIFQPEHPEALVLKEQLTELEVTKEEE